MNSEGIGLGLTIVKEIVALNEGSIDVFSEGEGKGSEFIFTMKMQAVGVARCTEQVSVTEEEENERNE